MGGEKKMFSIIFLITSFKEFFNRETQISPSG